MLRRKQLKSINGLKAMLKKQRRRRRKKLKKMKMDQSLSYQRLTCQRNNLRLRLIIFRQCKLFTRRLHLARNLQHVCPVSYLLTRSLSMRVNTTTLKQVRQIKIETQSKMRVDKKTRSHHWTHWRPSPMPSQRKLSASLITSKARIQILLMKFWKNWSHQATPDGNSLKSSNHAMLEMVLTLTTPTECTPSYRSKGSLTSLKLKLMIVLNNTLLIEGSKNKRSLTISTRRRALVARRKRSISKLITPLRWTLLSRSTSTLATSAPILVNWMRRSNKLKNMEIHKNLACLVA